MIFFRESLILSVIWGIIDVVDGLASNARKLDPLALYLVWLLVVLWEQPWSFVSSEPKRNWVM